ncbi:MAG: hypothetical protein JNL97_16830 [Verrucomicrobiales bacterium]|nr:hypothetical protein [Verrucomicrobiales bacterium]
MVPHVHSFGSALVRRARRVCRFLALLPFAGWVISPPVRAQGSPDYELPPIEYSASEPSNRITRITAKLNATRPPVTEGKFLRWLLEQNEVPVESQVLVFAKTSLQRDLIAPRQPRSLFFNDDLYMGWVPGGLMEVTVTDPKLGMVFYKLDSRDIKAPLRFERDADCLSCHGGSMTRNWPGLMIRSVYPDERGEPITSAGSTLVTHDTPLEQRWGGWYVTGKHGDARHLGNAFARDAGREAVIDREAGANLTSLDKFFPTATYLRPDSDIVALMVLEHQALMHDRLCEGALRVRKWSHYQRQLQKEMGEPVTEYPTGTALRVLQHETERIVEALLFCDEIRLPESGVSGAGDFEKAFARNRRPDAKGRSLKDFDLKTRMFAHRCSYMVYSEAFESLPLDLKNSVLRRLDGILTAATPPPRFAHLPAEERATIREILQVTLPAYATAIRL